MGKIIIFKKYRGQGVEGYGNTFKNWKLAFTDEIVPYYSKTWTCNLHPATKEQRGLLFKKIKETGYKWNTETNTFEKLVEPKFDPNELKPFDKVLVKDRYYECWMCELYSHKRNEEDSIYRYVTTNSSYIFCIPYNDETKHLVGTTEEAPDYYRYWED